MPVAFILDFDSGDAGQYDRVMEKMRLDGRVAPGALFHVAGLSGFGWRVIDVWESDEAFQQFAQEKIGPLTAEEGLPEPKITRFEAHRIFDERGGGQEMTFFQVVHLAGVDAATFDEADAEIRPGDGAPDGVVYHVNGQADGEWIVADGWTSKDVRDRFVQERIGPEMAKRDMPMPTIEDLEVHNTLAAA